jgi:uncharacterized small protein (DUF1192 family)
MFDEEELPKKKSDSFVARNLERVSVDELYEYIQELQAEIARTEQEITRKKAASTAASSFFK